MGTLPSGELDLHVIEPGEEAVVDEDVAAEFCDKRFNGMYSFAGERSTPTATRHVVTRAVRVA